VDTVQLGWRRALAYLIWGMKKRRKETSVKKGEVNNG
jgi:hypothetical protein